MFADVIEMLLQKRAELRAEIEREYAARAEKINELLALAGYVEPADALVIEAVEQAEATVVEPVEEVDEAEEVSEATPATAKQIVY